LFLCRKLFLLLRKSTKIVPSRVVFLAQISTKSLGGWGNLQCFPDPLAVFRGPISKKWKREEVEGR